MKNVLGKLLVMATVSVMTLGVYSEPDFTPDQSYEITIDPAEDEPAETNIITDEDADEFFPE